MEVSINYGCVKQYQTHKHRFANACARGGKLGLLLFILFNLWTKSNAQSQLYSEYLDTKDSITPDWFDDAIKAYELNQYHDWFVLINKQFLNEWVELIEIQGYYSGLGNTYYIFYDHINQTYFFNSDKENFNSYILEMGLSESWSRYDLALFYLYSKGWYGSYISYNKNDSVIHEESVFQKKITKLLPLTIIYGYKKKTVKQNRVRLKHIHPIVFGRCVSGISTFIFNKDNTIKKIQEGRYCCLNFGQKLNHKDKKLNCPSDRRYLKEIRKKDSIIY